jgi:hypothetical protein
MQLKDFLRADQLRILNQWGNPGGGEQGYTTEYQAVYNEFGTTPSVADAAAQNTFVKSLVDNGIWTELDRLFILASHASGADSLLDWINPSTGANAATLVNAPAYVKYQGYTSDGSTSYINFNYPPDSLPNVAQNDGGYFGYTRNQADTNVLWGVRDPSPIDRRVYIRYNNEAAIHGSTKTASVTTATGMKYIERNNASNFTTYENGVVYLTKSNTSGGLPDINVFGLCYNFNGTPSTYTTSQLSLHGAGTALGATKQLALYNAFQTLMTYYGTQV